MAHFEEVEVVAIMPQDKKYGINAHALGADDGTVYAFMDGVWSRMMKRPYSWKIRVDAIENRKIYRGKFLIKAWVE